MTREKLEKLYRLFQWGVLGMLAAVLGFGVVLSGVVPIKASSGHWGITAWFLNFAKERSVATHTLGGPELVLEGEWQVLKGAGAYDATCQPCHGSPETQVIARVMQGATPSPPFLPHHVGKWDADALFYITKHGIKFTGMPAWPALQRDDEVRAMTAFLLRLKDLKPEEYRALVRPQPGTPGAGEAPVPPGQEAGAALHTGQCLRCHGADGGGRGTGAFPKLAGQRREYLLAAMDAYTQGTRHSGVMEPLAAGLTAEHRRALADYYAALPPSPTRSPAPWATAESVERGRRIAHEGLPQQRVPGCVQCHGPKPTRVNPHYPTLAGQYAEYLFLQLQLFHDDVRGGSPYRHLMHEVAPRLTGGQMRDVAAYYASLPAEPAPAPPVQGAPAGP